MEARIEQNDRDDAYRIYSAEMLRYLNKSLGNDLISFMDILRPPKEETRTPEQIISGISEKLNRLGGE